MHNCINRYNIKDAPTRAKRLVSHGDIIWSTVRPNRKSFLLIRSPAANLVVSTGFAVITPEGIPPSYLYLWVTTERFVDYLSYSADGSAYPIVRPERIIESKIVIPSTTVLELFDNICAP
jgi:type I restriction enzyme, S subunit